MAESSDCQVQTIDGVSLCTVHNERMVEREVLDAASAARVNDFETLRGGV